MSEIEKIFSSRLKACRGEQSQAEFAAFLGIVQQSYSRYERGTVPDLETLLKIASKLDLTLLQLTGINWGGAPMGSPTVTFAVEPSALHEGNLNVVDEALREVQTIRDALNDLERKLKKLKL